MSTLIAIIERLPASFVETMTWSYRHPVPAIAGGLAGATLWASGWINIYFHRRDNRKG